MLRFIKASVGNVRTLQSNYYKTTLGKRFITVTRGSTSKSGAFSGYLKGFAILLPVGFGLKILGDQKLKVLAEPSFKNKELSTYENRIRKHSSLERVFRYFATVECEGNIYMTRDDFLRSIMPGELQPENLRMDQFQKIPKKQLCERTKQVQSGSFFHTDHGQLINFAEFLFLRSVLVLPLTSLSYVFKMLDLDNSGTLEKSEFLNIIKKIARKNKGTSGKKSNLGKIDEDSYIVTYLFQNRNSVNYNSYEDFVKGFRHNVLEEEYKRISKGKPCTLAQFGAFVMAIHQLEDSPDAVSRLKALPTNKVIRFEEFKQFQNLVNAVDELEDAVSLHCTGNMTLNKQTFRRACELVCTEKMTDDLIDVVFAVFDTDGDGKLSYKELFQTLKLRSRVGQERRELGAERGIKALFSCIKTQLSQS